MVANNVKGPFVADACPKKTNDRYYLAKEFREAITPRGGGVAPPKAWRSSARAVAEYLSSGMWLMEGGVV